MTIFASGAARVARGPIWYANDAETSGEFNADIFENFRVRIQAFIRHLVKHLWIYTGSTRPIGSNEVPNDS